MTHFVVHYGLWVVFLVVFVEVAGLPFIPGETALISAAALASQGHGNIVAIIVVAFAAAVLGTLASYVVGRRWGRDLLRRSAWIERHTEKGLDRGQAFFAKHGSKAVFLGRFAPVVRALLGWMAGFGEMGALPFMIWNVLGAAAWSSAIGLLAYYVGDAVIKAVERDLLYGIAAIVGVVLVIGTIHYLQHRAER